MRVRWRAGRVRHLRDGDGHALIPVIVAAVGGDERVDERRDVRVVHELRGVSWAWGEVGIPFLAYAEPTARCR
jgi:hypothetical protein